MFGNVSGNPVFEEFVVEEAIHPVFQHFMQEKDAQRNLILGQGVKKGFLIRETVKRLLSVIELADRAIARRKI